MNTPSDQMPPTPPPAAAPPPRPAGRPDAADNMDDRNIAMLTHLSGLLFSIIVPLVVWLLHKDRPEKQYVVAEAKEALNFQITVLIAYIICWVLTIILIGFFLFWLVWLVNLVLCIMAAVQVSNSGSYRYPFSLRLVN